LFDSFDGTTINNTRWNNYTNGAITIFQNNSIVINGTSTNGGADDFGRISLNDKYVDLAYDFNATIDLYPLYVARHSNNGTIAEIALGNDNYESKQSCSLTWTNTTTLLSAMDYITEAESESSGLGANLNGNLTMSYTASDQMLNCTFYYSSNSRSVNVKISDYSGDTNHSLNLYGYVMDMNSEEGGYGDGYFKIRFDNFRFNTSYSAESGSETVPEWEDYALLFILTIVIGGFFAIRKNE